MKKVIARMTVIIDGTQRTVEVMGYQEQLEKNMNRIFSIVTNSATPAVAATERTAPSLR